MMEPHQPLVRYPRGCGFQYVYHRSCEGGVCQPDCAREPNLPGELGPSSSEAKSLDPERMICIQFPN